jgi:hypothetical protein
MCPVERRVYPRNFVSVMIWHCKNQTERVALVLRRHNDMIEIQLAITMI